MAQGLLFITGFFSVVMFGSAESCIPHSIEQQLPEVLTVGYVLLKVDLDPCDINVAQVTTSNSDFSTQTDGNVITLSVAAVPLREKTFSVFIHDQSDQIKKVDVNLVERSKGRRRSKRRWSMLPFNIKENDVPPFPKEIDLVASDSSVNYSVYYRISGPGVTEPPIGLFSVSSETGMLKVHRPVDREQYAQFIFEAKVFDRLTHKQTDLPLPLTVNVEDENDNAPEFSGSLQLSVMEQCNTGTLIGKINATDRDDPETDHTKIKYTLLTGGDMFLIHSATGVITTKTAALDREVQDKHLVTVQIKDMNGADNGLSSTGTATISLRDINDNPPTFRETAYAAKIKENQADVLILRIPVDDKDVEKTPNWNAVFVISKGNENGNFRIDTDPKTNEGLLYVIKPLDHETSKNVLLEVSAQNEAPLVGTKATWASIPVDVTVGDEDEGPEFTAPTLLLRVKEDVASGTLIGTYTAVDPETKSSKGIKYYKLSDPASWINVNETTGGLTVISTVDRESPFVTGNMYNITVKAVDQSSKTGTGTVLIQIEDLNDNEPNIPVKDMILCEKDGEIGSVLVEAEDKDLHPFSGPFTFELGEGHDGKWRLKDIKETSVVLEQTRDLPTGQYTIPLLVKDLQSFGKVQTVTVRICQCSGGACVAQQSSTALGVWGILAILLALALLVLLCIFFTFACTTEKGKIYLDDSSIGMLLKSNTEAPGEEGKSSNIVIVPSTAVDSSLKGGFIDRQGTMTSGTLRGQQTLEQSMQQSISKTSGRDFIMTDSQNVYSSGHYSGTTYAEGGMLKYSEFSSLDTWKTNGLYLDKKLTFFVTEEEGRFADDLLHTYGYEGEGSPAGSVGCCSDQVGDEDLAFLDTLGPKFRTLAEVCAEK
ncbi:hypothetical protein MATL_G00034310 [Megalops atlanticus]|uniref:Cadherin domain-containing protein n=1 Tax=Megalops atlanticus TaxID=7932 RepID=A0A9D3QDC7_MEGAT|nr:hypothetical protein MATL_G00034310 [Megalops atlanticus]